MIILFAIVLLVGLAFLGFLLLGGLAMLANLLIAVFGEPEASSEEVAAALDSGTGDPAGI